MSLRTTVAVSLMTILVVAFAACGTDRPAADQPNGLDRRLQPANGVGDAADPIGAQLPAKTTEDDERVTDPESQPTRVPDRPYIDVPGVIKSFSDIPAPRGPNLEPPYLSGDQVLERIAELAPGFGGIYVSGARLVIILNDESQIDRAIAAVAAFYGADEITETVRIERGMFEFVDLARWYRIASDIVWQIDGIYSSHIDERNGKIEFGFVTQKTADRAAEALKDSGIPAEVIIFDVKQPELLANFKVNVRSHPGIEIELEAPSEVTSGETVSLAVVLVNRGDRLVEFIYNATTPEDIVVFRDGVEVWGNKGRVGAFTLAGRTSALMPGESVRFESEWSIVDNDLEPLAPGEYLIAASFSFGEEGLGRYSPSNVATEPVKLTVLGE